MMKILIADDHWVVRESLKLVMKRVEQRFEPFEAATFDQAKAILDAHPDINLMLIDLIMPGFEEFAGLQRLREEFPEVPVVVVSVHEDHEYIVKSISHGVVGYIPKSAGGEEIVRALERVLSGEVSFPRQLLERTPASLAKAQSAIAQDAAAEHENALTAREREVLDQLGKGLSVARMATDLGLSPHTVRVHIGNIMKKLGLKDRSAAIHYAVTVRQSRADHH
jgi:DNA-binding NarL/FixJ family response regulator